MRVGRFIGRRGLSLLLWLATAIAAAAPDVAAPLVFFGDRDLAPYEFIEDGQPRGASVDLARAVGRELGRPVEVRLLPWGEAQARLLAGEGHALTRMGRTPEREARFAFSRPTLPGAFALFVRTGEEQGFDPHRLAGKRIGVTAAGLPRQVLAERHPGAVLVVVAHQADGTRRLLGGDIEALAAPVWSQLYLLKKMDIGGVTQLAPFISNPGHIAVRRGDTALLAQIDAALLSLQDKGEIDRISDRWSQQRVYLFTGFTVRMGQVAAGVAAVALLALALATVLLLRQRRELGHQVRACREAEDAARGSEQSTRRLQQLTAALAAAVTPEDVGAVVARHGGELLGTPQALLAEPVRDGRGWLALGAAGTSGEPQPDGHGLPASTEQQLSAAVAQAAPVVFESRAAALAAQPSWADARQEATYVAALRASGAAGEAPRAIGGLHLTWPETRSFTPETLEQLGALTTLVAQALERAQLRRGERQAAARQAVLQAMGTELNNARTVAEACAVVAGAGLREIGAVHSAVALFDEPPPPKQPPLPSAMLTLVHTAQLPPVLAAQFAQFRADAGMALTRAARSGEPVYLGTREEVEATSPEVCQRPEARHVQAAAALPLQAPVATQASWPSASAGPSRLGALLFAFAEPRDFEADERVFLEALAHMAARSIERCQLLARLQSSLDNSEAERRQQLAAHQRQREAELRLSLALDSAGMGSWDLDLHTGQALWTPRMYTLFGLPEGDGHERADGLLQRVLPEDRPLVEAALQQAATEGADFDATFRVRRGDGEVRWLLGRGRVLHNTGVAAGRMLGINFDITPIMQARQELEAANRQKDEFLAMLSHELRNPLAPIVNAAELLARAGERADMRMTAVQVIQRQAWQLTRLVGDLLEVSRIRHGHIDMQLQTLDLARGVESALETLRPTVEAQRHSLTVSLPPRPLWVHADPARLTQMLVNLVGNAVKYTQPGGRIELSALADGGFAVLRVQDNGLGIAADFLPRVFELFAQAGGTRDRADGGLGLGLALVKRLAELHGGAVEVASEGLGLGACFTLRLPLATPPG